MPGAARFPAPEHRDHRSGVFPRFLVGTRKAARVAGLWRGAP
jgi:hypothetical protein